VGDFLSQPKRSTHPPPATSMDFVPGSQQSIESMHPVTHVKTAYKIGDHVYVSCKGENGPQTMDVGCVKQFGLQNGQQAVRVQGIQGPHAVCWASQGCCKGTFSVTMMPTSTGRVPSRLISLQMAPHELNVDGCFLTMSACRLVCLLPSSNPRSTWLHQGL